MAKKNITVIGSINMDLVTKTEQVPMMGETLLGEAFYTIPGGKGANQAVAAARLGAEVSMIGCVGDDPFGRELLAHLGRESIHTDAIKVVAEVSTGIASITLSGGDNSIIVVPGANYHVTPEFVAGHEELIAASDIILLQLEIPMESVEMASSIAKKYNVKVILNPAPFQPIPDRLLENADYFTPNEHEQKLLLSHDWSEEKRESFLRKCIVTQGEKGVSIFSGTQIDIPGYKVKAIDTTGAGDTFNGALAYSLSEGMGLSEACRFANAAAALSVTKLGAQGGMPTKFEVNEFLRKAGENK
ncbi:ribokinase [Neobacillus notoginsengisoli]|uniref:Ribokinase n=1 Tax=Neobacillus notoginsengisoli TaxID=1578198 RepID=A0A417YXZ1_9BACI|nr:ribokinase [Neobacillus notoginsengisoli]RHW42591.1 ribokinase [Neobacillus notoginsengisoli]